MIGTRSRKHIANYKKHIKKLKPGDCQFCELSQHSEQVFQETKSFFVVYNIFPYTTWDLRSVAEHLMVVPKRHIESISKLTAPEAVEYIDLVGSFESRGYNIYSRAAGSSIKSVPHQHSHLIKTTGSMKRVLLYTKNSYLRFIV